MLLSIVVPCYNEEAVLLELHGRLVATLEHLEDVSCEIVYTDDGSHDQTPRLTCFKRSERPTISSSER